MVIRNLASVFFIGGIFSGVQAQNFQWANKIVGANATNNHTITIDSDNNVYTTGTFGYYVDPSIFGGINGIDTTIYQQGGGDLFVSRHNSNGELVWVKPIHGTLLDEGTSITTDGDNNVYVCGLFKGTTDFDPGEGEYLLTGAGTCNIFILKLNQNGDFQWAKKIENLYPEVAYSIVTDSESNVITTGYFTNTLDFDPDPAQDYFLTAPASQSAAFILKLDLNGSFLWAKAYESGQSSGQEVVVDQYDNLFVAGDFTGAFDLDPNMAIVQDSAVGNYRIFLTKLDPLGNTIWGRSYLSSGTGCSGLVNDICVTSDNGLVLVGKFQNVQNFDPQTSGFILTSQTSYAADGYVMKLDSQGNIVWLNQVGSDEMNEVLSVTSYGQDIFIAGNFYSDIDFYGAGAGCSNNGLFDIYLARLDQSGNYLWSETIGGVDNESIYSISASNSSVVLNGNFSSDLDFNFTGGNLLANSQYAMFIASYSFSALGLENYNQEHIRIYPNMNAGIFIFEIQEQSFPVEARIIDDQGKQIKSLEIWDESTEIELNVPNGVYFMQASNKCLKFIVHK